MDLMQFTVWIIFGSIVLVISSIALATFAGRRVGNFYLWVILFCLLPVISHIFFIYFLWVYLPQKRVAFKKISSHHKATDALITNIEKGPESTPSVTPFDDKEDLPE